MRRWTLRILGGIVVLVLLAALAVQVLFWTDLPRRWILDAASQYTGWVVQADAVAPSWWGHTSLRHVTLRRPLEREDFFSVDAVEVSHRSVLGLLVWRSLGLASVRIEGPQFYVRRTPDQQWNVSEALGGTLGAGGRRGNLAGVRLPQVRIEGASVHITDANNQSTVIGPFAFEGVRQKGRAWAFTLTSGPAAPRSTQPAVEVRGVLVADKEASHAADFRIEPNETWVTALTGRDLGPFHVRGHWEGRVQKTGVVGTVRLEPSNVGPVTLVGTTRITQAPGGVKFSPERMAVSWPALEGRQIRISGGNVTAGNKRIDFEGVQSELSALGVQLTGQWNLSTESGEMTASWATRLPGKGEHNGVSRITIKSPAVGRKEAHLATTLAGQSVLGAWRIVAQTQASGATWRQSRWRTTLTEGTWLWRSRQVNLDGAAADVALEWPVVSLINLGLPGAARVQAAAEYDISKRRWSTRLAAQGLHVTSEPTARLDLRLDAQGSDQNVAVSEFHVAQGADSLTASGQLALPACEIRNGRVQARWQQAAETPGTRKPGQWSCDANIAGPANPLRLKVKAAVTGSDVLVGRRVTPRLEIPFQGDIDSEQVTIQTERFELFGGQWQARAQHQIEQPLTHVSATVEDLPVQAGAEMAGLDVKCEGSARAQIELAVPNLDMRQSRAQGTWDVNQLSIPPLKARQAHGRLLIGGGLVQFDDTELVERAGKARGGMHFALDQPHVLFISFATSKWPMEWLESDRGTPGAASEDSQAQRLAVLLDSKADIQLDLSKGSTDGEGWFSGQLLCAGQAVGQTGASVSLRDGVLEVSDLTGDFLGGSVEGSARIPLSQWTAGSGKLQWRDVQLSRLGGCWPLLGRLEGTSSGALEAIETKGRVRPLEPVRLELRTSFANGHIGAAQFDECRASAFLGRRRLLVDKFDMDLCGGRVSAWGQLSPHTGILSLSLGMDFNDVDLNQLARAVGAEGTKIKGKLAGQGTLITATDWRQLNGEARLHVKHSDLGENPIIRTLFDALSLNLGSAKPEGTGELNIRFSGARVAFPSFVYFNQGVEVRGAGQIDDFHLGKASPIQGYAVGSTRVLKNVQLPGISELDRLMATLQSGAATVIVKGTLGKPEAKIVPLPEVQGALRYLLWQQLRENK